MQALAKKTNKSNQGSNSICIMEKKAKINTGLYKDKELHKQRTCGFGNLLNCHPKSMNESSLLNFSQYVSAITIEFSIAENLIIKLLHHIHCWAQKWWDLNNAETNTCYINQVAPIQLNQNEKKNHQLPICIWFALCLVAEKD